MSEECLRLVGWIEKGALGLTAVFSLAGWVVGGPAVAAGVAAGGLVALVNFKALRWFTARAVVSAGKKSVKGIALTSQQGGAPARRRASPPSDKSSGPAG